ncbi:MAG TPA: hypothetical protein PLV25_07345, partial [Opitutales bacterium]|nr:hypothetical protein [Opitutales bacterium]
ALNPWRQSAAEVWFLIASNRALIFDTAAQATQVLSESSLAIQGQLGPITDVLLEVGPRSSISSRVLAGQHYWIARQKVMPSEEILVLCKPGAGITDVFFRLYGIWVLGIAMVPLLAMFSSLWLVRPYFERLKAVGRFAQRLADQDWKVLPQRPQVDELNAPILKSMQRIAQDLRSALEQFNDLVTLVQNIRIQFKDWISKQERLVFNEEGCAEQLSVIGSRLVNELEGISDALRELDHGSKQSAHHARQCQEPLGALKKTLGIVKENSQHMGAKIASIHD